MFLGWRGRTLPRSVPPLKFESNVVRYSVTTFSSSTQARQASRIGQIHPRKPQVPTHSNLPRLFGGRFSLLEGLPFLLPFLESLVGWSFLRAVRVSPPAQRITRHRESQRCKRRCVSAMQSSSRLNVSPAIVCEALHGIDD